MRVLIADDEAVIRMDLQEILCELGHHVVASVSNGAEALEHARLLQPDLLILDVKMPIMDGITAAEALKKERLGPILLLTAFSDRHLIDKANRAGVFGYLLKPFTEADIDAAITIAVSRYHEAGILEERARELSQSLEQRKVIERAKGRIMELNGISEPAAFDYIRKRSLSTGTSMYDVAAQIVKKMR